MTTPTLEERLTAQIERNEIVLAAWRTPAPEPPAWLEEHSDIQADLEAIEEEDREYLYMLAEEEAMLEYYAIEDDCDSHIGAMMGAW